MKSKLNELPILSIEIVLNCLTPDCLEMCYFYVKILQKCQNL